MRSAIAAALLAAAFCCTAAAATTAPQPAWGPDGPQCGGTGARDGWSPIDAEPPAAVLTAAYQEFVAAGFIGNTTWAAPCKQPQYAAQGCQKVVAGTNYLLEVR